MNTKPNRIAFTTQRFDAVATPFHIYSREMTPFAKKVEIFLWNTESQKSHGYAGINREEKFANWAVSEESFMSTHYILYPKH